MSWVTDEDDILAAEFALGLLDPTEAEVVRDRARLDGPLSLRIAWWRDQLAPLAGEAEVLPPAGMWPRIAAGIGANDNGPVSARRWKWVSGGLGAAVAILLGVIVLRTPSQEPLTPPAVAPAPSRSLVASLSGADGSAVTIAYDSDHSRMLVTPVSLDSRGGDAELWLIPAGATAPVSMGVIDPRNAASHSVAAAHSRLLAPGAVFAISREPRGGSPRKGPTGPVIASGKIIRV